MPADPDQKDTPYNQSYRFDDVEKQFQLLHIQWAELAGAFDLDKAKEALVKRIRKFYGLTNKYSGENNVGRDDAGNPSGSTDAGTTVSAEPDNLHLPEDDNGS